MTTKTGEGRFMNAQNENELVENRGAGRNFASRSSAASFAFRADARSKETLGAKPIKLHKKRQMAKSADSNVMVPLQKRGWSFKRNKILGLTPPNKHSVQIRFEREIPLPVAIAHRSYETRINTFRSFEIND